MATEHAVRRPPLLGAVAAAVALVVSGCSGGSGGSSSLVGVGSSSAPASGGGAPASSTASPAVGSAGSASAADGGGEGGSSGSGAAAAAGGYASAALPASVWINPSAIPLDAAYHWSSPAAVDKKAGNPELTAAEDCRLSLSGADKSALGVFPAAQAQLGPTSGGTGGQDDWTATETVVAAGDTSSGDIQGVYMLYHDLSGLIGKCANAAPGAKVTDVSSTQAGYAATITIPTSTGTTLTLHEYLAAPYGYFVELSVWVAPFHGDKPSAAWDGASAGSVLAALASGPCAASKAC